MKKKIIGLVAALMLVSGVVSASSINGDYKGNPIVKVTANGKQLETDEVPGVILDGHTVVPISLLRQLGASVTWNAEKYSVEVNLRDPQSNPTSENKNDVTKLTKTFKPNGYSYVSLISDGEDYTALEFIGTKPLSDLLAANDTFLAILKSAVDNTTATYVSIGGSDNNSFSVASEIVKDYFIGKKTEAELKSFFKINGVPLSSLDDNSTNNSQQKNSGSYGVSDALAELGFPANATVTVDARSLAIDLVELRKTKKQSDYSVQDALKDLGIPQGSIPTLATLKQAVKLISLK